MNEMIYSGVELMFTGMLVVYLFLALLVVAIKSMAAIVARYFPQLSPDFITTQKETDPQIIAAISAAIQQYRNKSPK
jgi:oxaloacetate decarboxylase gamma subunit